MPLLVMMETVCSVWGRNWGRRNNWISKHIFFYVTNKGYIALYEISAGTSYLTLCIKSTRNSLCSRYSQRGGKNKLVDDLNHIPREEQQKLMITLLGWIETGIIKNNMNNNRTKAPEMVSLRTFPKLFMILRGNCKVEKFLFTKFIFLRILRRPPLLDFNGGIPRSSSRITIVPCSMFRRIIIV